MLEKWPNFFIVGAPRAGTTSLYSYLNDTPGIYMSTIKEPRFFHHNLPESNLSIMHDKKKYLGLFRNVKDEKSIGEASPTYLYDSESSLLIHKVIPHAKIIIILRDPVERAFSHYLLLKIQGIEKRSFHEAITRSIDKRKNGINDYSSYLDPGLYTKQVKRYVDIFGTNVLILIFEELIKNKKEKIKEVLDFLEVDAEPPIIEIEKVYNAYGVPRGKIGRYIFSSQTLASIASRIMPQSLKWKLKEKLILKKEEKPELEKEDRYALESFYLNDVKELQSLLKRKIPWYLSNTTPN